MAGAAEERPVFISDAQINLSTLGSRGKESFGRGASFKIKQEFLPESNLERGEENLSSYEWLCCYLSLFIFFRKMTFIDFVKWIQKVRKRTVKKKSSKTYHSPQKPWLTTVWASFLIDTVAMLMVLELAE